MPFLYQLAEFFSYFLHNMHWNAVPFLLYRNKKWFERTEDLAILSSAQSWENISEFLLVKCSPLIRYFSLFYLGDYAHKWALWSDLWRSDSKSGLEVQA